MIIWDIDQNLNGQSVFIRVLKFKFPLIRPSSTYIAKPQNSILNPRCYIFNHYLLLSILNYPSSILISPSSILISPSSMLYLHYLSSILNPICSKFNNWSSLIYPRSLILNFWSSYFIHSESLINDHQCSIHNSKCSILIPKSISLISSSYASNVYHQSSFINPQSSYLNLHWEIPPPPQAKNTLRSDRFHLFIHAYKPMSN